MAAAVSTSTRRFTVADQQWFARVTGDRNPLHLDADWAAATFPGELVVHGVHALLWGLDRHLAAHGATRVHTLHATFTRPILVGDEVEAESEPDGSVFRLLVRGKPMVVVRFQHRTAAALVDVPGPATNRPPQRARDRSMEQLVGATGTVALPDDIRELADAFPALAAAVGLTALSGIAALSTLVGMECPGLHSMLSELSVSVIGSEAKAPLAFRVKKWHAAFSRADMEVSGFGIAGSVAAFAGRAEPPPLGDAALRALVSPTEFAGQRPLVVGSGLGALTARLLAAGGAQPVLTWCRSRGATDEIARTWNGRCQLVQFDARTPADGLAALAKADWQGSQVYYFASPRIFRRRLELYQSEDLSDFLRIYVDGFYELVRGLMKMRREARLAIFYPSTVALDEAGSDLFEYRFAKLMGEQLCARMQQKYKSLALTVTRLPRIATRQTQAFSKVQNEEGHRVMLPIVRDVQGIVNQIAV
jgi:acyl dehydratase/NAD(P)-dependent dehydrogenase (short-subunit alcohol dehydrogenase family)